MTNTKPEYQGQPLDLQPAVDLDEWQPMETAPRTGEPIEVWRAAYRCVVTVIWGEDLAPFNRPWESVGEDKYYAETRFTGWRRQSKGPQL